MEELLRGLTSQIAEREDEVLCTDIREKLFGPIEFSRRDLATLNIMRGRDSGLPDYNTVRATFGLPEIQTLEDINPERFATNPELLKSLEEVYNGHLDDIDLYVGGMLETGDDPGPLFSAIILEQFQRLRDSDRSVLEIMHGTVQGDIESTSILKPDTDVSSSYLNEVTQNRSHQSKTILYCH